MSESGDHRADPPTGSEENSGGDAGPAPRMSFKDKALRGSAISLIQTVVTRTISLGCQIVFARMLLPSDYGLQAIAIGTMSLLTIASPLALEDVLVQRGKRLANVLPSAWRLMFFSGCLMAVAILCSSQVVSNRSGEAIRGFDAQAVTEATPLFELDSDPPFSKLLEDVGGEVLVQHAGEEASFSLPTAVDDQTTLGDYVEQLDAAIESALGSNQVKVWFDSSRERVVLAASDGDPVTLETSDATAGNILGVLGIPYRSNLLMMMLLLITMRPLLQLLRTPFAAAARLSLRFEQIAIGFLIGDILGYGMGMLVLFMGGGPIALIMPILFLPLSVLVNSMRLSSPLPKVPRDQRESVIPLLKDAICVWLSQWSIGMSRNVPPLVLAIFVSDGETGLYSWAALISIQINVLLTDNMKTAMVPIFSKLQDQPNRLISGFQQATRAMSGVTLPLFAGATAITPILIPVVFTERWVPAISIAAILLMAQSFATTHSLCVSLLKGTGRYRVWLALQLTRTTTFIATAFLCSWLAGAVGLAIGMFVLYTIFPTVTLYICARGHGSMLDAIKVNGIPLLACAPFILVGIGASELEANWLSLLAWCPLMMLGGLLAYMVIMRVVDPARCREIWEILQQLKLKIQSLVRASTGR